MLQDGSDLQQSQSVTVGEDTQIKDKDVVVRVVLVRIRLDIFLPLYLRQELCLKDASGLQGLRDLPSEQESSLGHVYEDVSHDFSQVHATAHLLIPG